MTIESSIHPDSKILCCYFWHNINTYATYGFREMQDIQIAEDYIVAIWKIKTPQS